MKNETVTRADLCEAVHDEVGLTRQDCAGLVERTLDLVAEALEDGKTVKLSGFGVFQVRSKRARMGRNPKTGEPAEIEPRRVIGFRASQVMKARVDRALADSAIAVAKGPHAFRTISEVADDAFQSNASINAALAELDTAIGTLRQQASTFGSSLSVVEVRQDFTKNLINTLETGAANLTLADTNEEGANLLALQTRQQLSSVALSLASQADQNVLRLF